MILVRGRFCEFKDCKKLPHYNYINEKKPIYCGKHKLDSMVNIITSKCTFENCKKFQHIIIQMKKLLFIVTNINLIV